MPKRPKRTRIPASLDTGPVAARCGVGPPSLPVPDDGPVPATTVLPAVGPSVSIPSSSTSLPTASYPSLSQNRRPTKQHSATDCWYFIQAVESNVKPTDPPLQSESDSTIKALTEKPRTPYLRCKLCREWKCWKNSDGVVTTIRKHLTGTHFEEYDRVCSLFDLKHRDSNKPTGTTTNKSTATSGACPPQLNKVTLASRAQTRGFAGLSSLSTIRRTASLPSTGSTLDSDPSSRPSTPLSNPAAAPTLPPSFPTLSAAQMVDQEAEDAARDLAAVKDEIYRWKQVVPRSMDEPLDLVWFWEATETDFPLMFKVALDILPVQASAVSCERIFSSSKETCTMRRNLLSSALLEVLQVLKHVYKDGRLDFTSHLIVTEEDYSIESMTEAAINELISLGKTDELLDLLRSMDEPNNGT